MPKIVEQTIRLSASDGDRPVVVTPENQDRFMLSCAQAIEACRHRISKEVWLDELNAMLGHVQGWAEARRDKVRACYAAGRDGHIVIFISPRSEMFDFVLSDEITELDTYLACKFQACPCEILQVPGHTRQHLEAFVTPAEALLIYGDIGRPPQEVALQP